MVLVRLDLVWFSISKECLELGTWYRFFSTCSHVIPKRDWPGASRYYCLLVIGLLVLLVIGRNRHYVITAWHANICTRKPTQSAQL